ncbi:alpha/beta fold hydrolase [Prosthecodimorpha staleyi]|uniref:Alpha/beta hydrolase n=1 Tax=Prosthecodimorpha staleyi TaxID=2840188 RepID=A0A947D1G8_9HYPH|nr:alpha/beta hydrolase [Prosthecodimorpha staleyi]MBT9288916.1 alpha/beta hydrolase [Prosthecodimorpha staleyi]
MTIYDHEANPIPGGAVSGEIATSDGTRLRFARWPALAGTPKGTVVVVQGRAEFLEKYFETVRDLQVRGFAVATFDLRGQGGSGRDARVGPAGHVGDFRDYQADIEAVMAEVVMPNCPPPYYGVGHSTGATILIGSAPAMRTRFRRLVLLSPLLGFGDHGWPTSVIGPLAGALAMVGFARTQVPGAARHVLYPRPFAGNRLTSDERRFSRAAKLAEAHPELTVGAPTIGWIRAATDAMVRLDDIDFVDRIRIPTLIVAAGADKVVSNAATERFARTLKIGHMITIPGARHELLMESDIYREQTFAAFDAFIPGS